MIYSTNRTTSLGDMSADVNESYFGIGAMSFMEECAHDELALFEAGIKSDIDEVMIGESGSELAALNEGFVQSAAAKIKEMMKKFIEWIAAVTRSAFAKLTQLIVRDNAKFAAAAKKKIITMKNKDKFKYKGKYLKGIDIDTDIQHVVDDTESVKKLFDDIKDKDSAETTKKALEDMKDAADKLSVSDAMKELVAETDNGDIKLVENHLKMLEALGKNKMKELKKQMDEARKDANDIAKKADKMLREANDQDREVASTKAEAAALYKAYVQKTISFKMGLIKAQAKVARSVVAKAMGATPKNEGFEYDEELTDAMIESVEYEYDNALEEMSEGSDCKDCDDDDIEDDDYDKDDE